MGEGTSEIGRESFLQRVPGMLLYGLLGVLVGLMGSFTHRARFDLAGVEIWYGVVVALACATAFAVGLRRAGRDRSTGVAYAVGVVAAIGFLAAGLSNSVVIVGDIPGLLWLGLTPLIVFGVAFWPRLPARDESRTAAAPVASPGTHEPSGYAGDHPSTSLIPPKESQS